MDLIKSGIEYIVKDSTARGTAGAMASLKRIEREIGAVQRMLKTGLTLGVGYLGLRGVVSQVRELSQTIDSAAKASDRLGLRTEVYMGLQHAASLAGMGVEQLRVGLEQMTRKVSEAAQGAGEARYELKDLGLDAKALAQMNPQQMLYEIADAIAAVENPADRVRIAIKLFGESGARMVNMLEGGADALRATQTEAERLGIAIGRVDAAKIEQAKNAMTRLHGVTRGLLMQAIVELAPYVEAIATKFTDAATAGGGFGEVVVGAMERVGLAAAKVLDTLEKIAAIPRKLEGAAYTFGFMDTVEATTRARYEQEIRAQGREPYTRQPVGGFGQNMAYGQGPPKYQSMYDAIKKQVLEQQAQYYDPTAGGAQSSSNVTEVERFFADVKRRAAEAESRIQQERLEKDYVGFATPFGGMGYLDRRMLPTKPLESSRTEALDAEATAAEKARAEAGRLYESLVREQEIVGRVADSHDHAADLVRYEQAVRAGYAGDIDTQTRLIEDYGKALDDLQRAEFVNKQMDTLADTLTDIAMDFDNAADAAEQFFRALARQAISEYVAQPFTDALGGWLRGSMAGSNPTPAQVGGGANEYNDLIPGRQHGGSVWPGEPYWVGERGRELFVPSQAGQIVPASGGGSAGPKNLNVRIVNEGGSPVEAESATMDVDLNDMIVSIILRDHDTGGRTRSGLRR